MAESDWNDFSDNLSGSAVKAFASGSFTPPPGGGIGLFAFRSQVLGTGNHSKYYNGSGFNPTASGAIVQGALKRGPSAGLTGAAVYLFALGAGTTNTAVAYLLGLADGAPAHLVLRKGAPSGGLPDVAPVAPSDPTFQGVLWRSTDVVAEGTWAHLRLNVAVNLSGDAVLSVWRSSLTAPGASVVSPSWVQVAGVNCLGQSGSGISDDPGGINTGSPALTTGVLGWGFWCNAVGRVGYVDALAATAQP